MANQNQVTTGGGGFLRILGIIYLVKMIRQRRKERSQRAVSGETDSPGGAGPGRRPGA